MNRRFVVKGFVLVLAVALLCGYFYLKSQTNNSQIHPLSSLGGTGTVALADKLHTIQIFLKADSSTSQALALKTMLEKQSDVQSLQYISAEQTLADFKARHKGDPVTLQAMNKSGTNPFGGTITVKISDPSQKQSIINLINTYNITSSVI